jgi:hypothetical protein
MKTAKLLSCLAVFALALGAFYTFTASQAAAGDDNAEYTLIIKKCEVKTTNKNGEAWDVNDGKPDLMVIVRNLSDKDSSPFKTKEKTDTFLGDFNEPTNMKCRAGHTLEFEVADVDVAVNDRIGKLSKALDAKILKDGKLRMENFEQVIYLEVEFKKL